VEILGIYHPEELIGATKMAYIRSGNPLVEEQLKSARTRRREGGTTAQGASRSQEIYQREVLPGQVQAVEEQLGAVRRAGGAEQAASTARSRDISKSLGGAAPGGFEETLRGAITQEAGAALGYESALRGAKAQREVQDPSRLTPIVAERESALMDLQQRITDEQTAGQAVSTASSLVGGTLVTAAGIAATLATSGTITATAASTASAFGPVGLIVGAIIAIVGGIVGLAISGEAGREAGKEAQSIAEEYDPSKVQQVGFQSALQRAQNTRGFLGSQFTGGATRGAGIPNYGGLAPLSEEAAPWTQFTGVPS